MKNWLLITLFACFLFLSNAHAQSAKHVVLVTIDGFRPDFYMDPSWGAVNLRQLKEDGVCSKGVHGIFPTVTFPSHTTLVTGVRPDQHGIYYNAPFQPNGPSEDWYWYYSAIKVPTLWDAVHKAGMTTGSVLWPVTAGAPIDHNVADIWEAGELDRLAITRRNATPPGFWEEVQREATGALDANDFNLAKDYLSMDENVARIAAYIIRRYKPSFTALHLPAVDHAEHADGRDGAQVRRAVSGADRSVRTIVEAIDKAGISDSTILIITGDHGFGTRRTMFSPNILLAKAGLIDDVSTGKWKARFHSAGGSTFLHLKNQDDGESLSKVKEILASLPADEKKLFTIIEGKRLRESGADPNAVLALAGTEGTGFGNAVEGDVVRESHGGTHGYYPDFPGIQTGFIVSGPNVRKGTVLQVIQMVDIAPFIARLLNVDFNGRESKLYSSVISK